MAFYKLVTQDDPYATGAIEGDQDLLCDWCEGPLEVVTIFGGSAEDPRNGLPWAWGCAECHTRGRLMHMPTHVERRIADAERLSGFRDDPGDDWRTWQTFFDIFFDQGAFVARLDEQGNVQDRQFLVLGPKVVVERDDDSGTTTIAVASVHQHGMGSYFPVKSLRLHSPGVLHVERLDGGGALLFEHTYPEEREFLSAWLGD